MATPLDTSLLGHFQVIFPFFLILVLSYAILVKISIFKGNTIPGLLSVIFAIMLTITPIARDTVLVATPWFIILFFFIIMVLLAYMTLGASQSEIMGVLKTKKYQYISTWVIALAIIIMIGSLTSVIAREGGVGKPLGDVQPVEGGSLSEQESEFWNALFHPKVLGLALIMLIAMFTVQRLTSE